MDDIKAIRDALAGVNFYKKGGFSYTIDEWNKAVNPLRIARLLDALELARNALEEISDGEDYWTAKGMQEIARDALASMSAAPQSPAADQSAP